MLSTGRPTNTSSPEVSSVLLDHAPFEDAQPWFTWILLWSLKQLRRSKKARSGQCAATGKYVSVLCGKFEWNARLKEHTAMTVSSVQWTAPAFSADRSAALNPSAKLPSSLTNSWNRNRANCRINARNIYKRCIYITARPTWNPKLGDLQRLHQNRAAVFPADVLRGKNPGQKRTRTRKHVPTTRKQGPRPSDQNSDSIRRRSKMSVTWLAKGA